MKFITILWLIFGLQAIYAQPNLFIETVSDIVGPILPGDVSWSCSELKTVFCENGCVDNMEQVVREGTRGILTSDASICLNYILSTDENSMVSLESIESLNSIMYNIIFPDKVQLFTDSCPFFAGYYNDQDDIVFEITQLIESNLYQTNVWYDNGNQEPGGFLEYITANFNGTMLDFLAIHSLYTGPVKMTENYSKFVLDCPGCVIEDDSVSVNSDILMAFNTYSISISVLNNITTGVFVADASITGDQELVINSDTFVIFPKEVSSILIDASSLVDRSIVFLAYIRNPTFGPLLPNPMGVFVLDFASVLLTQDIFDADPDNHPATFIVSGVIGNVSQSVLESFLSMEDGPRESHRSHESRSITGMFKTRFASSSSVCNIPDTFFTPNAATLMLTGTNITEDMIDNEFERSSIVQCTHEFTNQLEVVKCFDDTLTCCPLHDTQDDDGIVTDVGKLHADFRIEFPAVSDASYFVNTAYTPEEVSDILIDVLSTMNTVICDVYRLVVSSVYEDFNETLDSFLNGEWNNRFIGSVPLIDITFDDNSTNPNTLLDFIASEFNVTSDFFGYNLTFKDSINDEDLVEFCVPVTLPVLIVNFPNTRKNTIFDYVGPESRSVHGKNTIFDCVGPESRFVHVENYYTDTPVESDLFAEITAVWLESFSVVNSNVVFTQSTTPPAFFMKYSALRRFEVINTTLSTFPDIATVPRLQTLVMRNVFADDALLPKDVEIYMTHLVNLDLSENSQLSGDISDYLLQKKYDHIFDISGTEISGTVNPEYDICRVRAGFVCRLSSSITLTGACAACTVA